MARSGSNATACGLPGVSLAANQEPRPWPDFSGTYEKEQGNLRKHCLDFTSASLIWAGPVLEKIDDRR
jgi:hypothetical protein